MPSGTEVARLQMDYVDLVFCHRPDVQTPIEETVRAMNHIVNQGKALYWGTSEWNAQQIQEAYGIARREHLIPPQMEQPEYNMFTRANARRRGARRVLVTCNPDIGRRAADDVHVRRSGEATDPARPPSPPASARGQPDLRRRSREKSGRR